MHYHSDTENIRWQKLVVAVTVINLVIKLFAYFLTYSVSILTDTLEGIVNLAAVLIGWYSLTISAKPRDESHPYGHGKIELISASAEGIIIVVSGFFMIYKAIERWIWPQPIEKLDLGLYLIAFSAIVNFVLGWGSVRKGRNSGSLALVANGKHLLSDTYSTLGIIIGLVLIFFTGWEWLDPLMAFIFGLVIIITGGKILRETYSGIMDAADVTMLNELISLLNEHRKKEWIDLHKLRIQKFGSVMHVDAHLTLPWYMSVRDAHRQMEDLETLVSTTYKRKVEFSIHVDPCAESSCWLCEVEDCDKRKHPFRKRITWALDNATQDQRHELKTDDRL